MAEGARLESVYTGNRIEGSNPSLSAMFYNRTTSPWASAIRWSPHPRARLRVGYAASCAAAPAMGVPTASSPERYVCLSWLVVAVPSLGPGTEDDS